MYLYMMKTMNKIDCINLKKEEMENYYVYMIEILDTPYYYYGSSYNIDRLYNHKSDCFCGTHTDIKFYSKIRELGITRETFYDRVKMNRIILKGLSKERGLYHEGKLIDANWDDEYCLNSRRENMGRYTKPKEYMENYLKTYPKKEQDKNYYEKNKDEILKSRKIYRDNNKSKINEKIKCEKCGDVVYKRGLKRHQNTLKCKGIKTTKRKPTKVYPKVICEFCGKSVSKKGIRGHERTKKCIENRK